MYGDCQVLSSSMAAAAAATGGSSVSVPSPEGYFGTSVHNPSGYGYMAPFLPFSSIVPKEEEVMCMLRDEEEESGGGGGIEPQGFMEDDDEKEEKLPVTSSTEDHHQQQPAAKKKRYHRHTAHQIQQMEALFKECPHPDDKQRLRLSQELGLKPRQVKFWFQNRRTQMKAQQDRSENVILRAENESLRTDNYRLQAAIRNVVCPNCGRPAVLGEMSLEEQHLRIENARLKDELERLTCIASRYIGRPPPSFPPAMCTTSLLAPPVDLDMSIYHRHFADHQPPMSCIDMIPTEVPPPMDGNLAAFDLGSSMGIVMEQDKPLVFDLAAAATDHLTQLCRAGEPMWAHRGGPLTCEFLNVEEHAKALQWPFDGKINSSDVGRRTEATRDCGVVMMNGITLVDAFMDPGKWMELFPSMVSKARALQVINAGGVDTGHLGITRPIILMQAELQFCSPLVPVREVLFFRYCVHNPDEGSWMIIDFPADGFEDRIAPPPQPASSGTARCYRRPSGCFIQDVPNGYSRVVWVEHVEMIGEKPLHPVFSDYVAGAAAFGATRWISLLQRQCERLASLLSRSIADLGVITTPEARKSLMKMSQRMIRTFCSSVCTSGSPSWTALSDSGDDTIRVATHKTADPGLPNGAVVLTAVSTKWLPFDHQHVFELLTDERRRSQIDILHYGGSQLSEIAHIANGSHPRNCVSLLRINAPSNSPQGVELLLQESSTHPAGGSLVVCATVDLESVQMAISGGGSDDADDLTFAPFLLPIGFSILPAPSSDANAAAAMAAGCLLTVGLQVVTGALPSAKLNLSSVTEINSHISTVVGQIAAALGGGGAPPEQPTPASG